MALAHVAGRLKMKKYGGSGAYARDVARVLEGLHVVLIAAEENGAANADVAAQWCVSVSVSVSVSVPVSVCLC